MGLLDQIGGQMEGVEHPQTEQVELDDPDRGAVVLVPLQDGAILHAAPLERDDIRQRTVGDHHPSRVDAEMTGEAVESPADVIDQIGGESGREAEHPVEAGPDHECRHTW